MKEKIVRYLVPYIDKKCHIWYILVIEYNEKLKDMVVWYCFQ